MAYSKRGYLALGLEAVAGTAVIPSKFMEFISETLTANKPVTATSAIATTRTKRLHINNNANEAITGEIVVEIEPNNIGYWLTGLMGQPTTDSTPAETTEYIHVYTAPYTTTALPTYTIEIAIGDDDSVRRYVGCKITSMSIQVVDNVLQATIGIMARYEFTTARITSATTAPTTTIPISQSSGLVVGDVLNLGLGTVNEEEKAVETLTSEISIETAATGNNHSADEIIGLKRLTPAYVQVCTITLTGTGGTANVTGTGALTKLATFNGTLTQTATDFVTAHTAAYAAVNVTVTSSGAVLTFTGSTTSAFIIPVITNASGNLAGTVAYTRAPQMNKLIFVGSQNVGTIGEIGSLIGSVAMEAFENFTFTYTNDFEARASAQTRNNINRYPSVILDKGYEASLTLSQYWKDMDRQNAYDFSGQQAFEIEAQGDLAGDTSIRSGLKIQLPDVRLTKQPVGNSGQDDIIQEDLEFNVAYDATEAYEAKITLTNKVSSYTT